MSRLILFNKPFGVISQFSAAEQHQTLAAYIDVPGVYPAGRLDKDSEGLLLLTDDGALQQRIANPRFDKQKTYLAQVEGEIDSQALAQLCKGVLLKDGKTRPARARSIEAPTLWPRNPPIRYRKNVPSSWLELILSEGRNRQVRRMTAAVGFPTLRLVRTSVADWTLAGLAPGEWRQLEVRAAK